MALSGNPALTLSRSRVSCVLVKVLAISFSLWVAASLLGAEDPQIAAAARKLHDDFPEVRAQGVVRLGELGAKQYAKTIAAMIKSDPDFQVRSAGVQVLGGFGAKEYAPDIAEMLKDRVQPQVRVQAAKALGKFAAEGYDPALAKLLQHNDPMVRGRLAYALAQAGAKAYAKDLVPLTKDSQRCTLYDEKTREYRIATTVEKIATKALEDLGGNPAKK